MAIVEITAELVGEGSQSTQAGVDVSATSTMVGEGLQSSHANVGYSASATMVGVSVQLPDPGFWMSSEVELAGSSSHVGSPTVRYWAAPMAWIGTSTLEVDPTKVQVQRFGRGPKVPVPPPTIPKIKLIAPASVAAYEISLRRRRVPR